MYCMPETDGDTGCRRKNSVILPHVDLLTYEELLRVVCLAVQLGMNKIRLTGGEPLVRKDILRFIARLTRIEGLHEVRLTTNGVLLEEYAQSLYDSGIRQLNISLDSLQRTDLPGSPVGIALIRSGGESWRPEISVSASRSMSWR